MNVTQPLASLICIILLTISDGLGQSITYLGIESAVARDRYEIIDPCKTIGNTRLITASMGLLIGQRVHENLSVESGLIWKYYNEGYQTLQYEYPVGPSAGISKAYDAFLVPLRLVSRLNLFRDKFFLNSTIGYHFGVNLEYGNDYVYNPDDYPQRPTPGYRIIGSDTIQTARLVEYTHEKKYFGLIETGLGLEYAFRNNFNVGLSVSYFTGLSDVRLEYISTGIANETGSCTTDNALGISQGGYSNLRFSLKYHIGKPGKKDIGSGM